jgi:hypothetical protein
MLDSAHLHTSNPATKSAVIVQKITLPSRGRPTIRPKVCVNAAGNRRQGAGASVAQRAVTANQAASAAARKPVLNTPHRLDKHDNDQKERPNLKSFHRAHVAEV